MNEEILRKVRKRVAEMPAKSYATTMEILGADLAGKVDVENENLEELLNDGEVEIKSAFRTNGTPLLDSYEILRSPAGVVDVSNLPESIMNLLASSMFDWRSDGRRLVVLKLDSEPFENGSEIRIMKKTPSEDGKWTVGTASLPNASEAEMEEFLRISGLKMERFGTYSDFEVEDVPKVVVRIVAAYGKILSRGGKTENPEEAKRTRKTRWNPDETRYVDSGVKLFSKRFDDPERIHENAERANVAYVVNGTDFESSQKAVEWSRTHDVCVTVGIHPHGADRARSEDYETFRKWAMENPNVVAIGETGLDYDRLYSSKDGQILNLERHVEIARELGLPMFLHERSAVEDFVAMFARNADMAERSLVHCFAGDEETLERYLEMGFRIGITGWICDDRRAGDLRRAVKKLPLDRVLVETDGPFLRPKNVSGLFGPNVPENVEYVTRELAKWMEVDEEMLRRATVENAEKFYERKPRRQG